MNEEFDKNKIPQPVEEQEIDLIELAKKVWANRKLDFQNLWNCCNSSTCSCF